MASDRIPKQNPRTAYRLVEDRGLLVVIDNRELHTLNEVAARVWSLCDGRAVDAIVEEIIAEFQVDAERARTDVDTFLAQLDGVGALSWSQP